MILQHPREALAPAGTARLLSLALPHAGHAIGLSWRSLAHAAGESLDPKHWAVLWLGSPEQIQKLTQEGRPFTLVDGKGRAMANPKLEGIVLIDGTWKQAKALTWRNRWLAKLPRLVLNPDRPSAYTPVRRQPKRACLSTIEAAAMAIDVIGKSPEAGERLTGLFRAHVGAVSSSAAPAAPAS